MSEYHKINAPFMRDGKGKMLFGEWCMPELEYLADNEWEFTEKVDGTNIRIEIHRIDDFLSIEILGRTDNAQIPKPLLASLNEIFGGEGQAIYNTPSNRFPLTDKIGKIMVERGIVDLVIYGEGYGPKINGGGKYSDVPKFVVFDVKVGPWWLLRNDVDDFCKTVGLDSVPVLFRGNLWNAMTLVTYGGTYDPAGNRVEYPIKDDDGCSRLKSQWGDFVAEGLVGVPAIPLFTRAGNRIITKIKHADFKNYN